MWFKTLNMYRLTAALALTADELAAKLEKNAFQPCSSMEPMRSGWTPPRDGYGLVHAFEGQFLLALTTETKVMPASAVNLVVKAAAKELEEQQGFPPGRKQTKELKERIADELLPRAFSTQRRTFVWIDTKNGWVVVDGSNARADEAIKYLLKAVDKLPLGSLRVARSPVSMMTEWLAADEAPAGFTVDQDCTLRAAGESKAEVRFTRATLDPADIQRHIAAGKQCTQLALTWNDRVSLVLTESLTIKRVAALDVINESEVAIGNDDDRFNADFLLMCGEYAALLAGLTEALGGIAIDGPDLLSEQEAEADDLYPQAVAVVQSNNRASISLIQRHLMIGYNRAARLMELMEKNAVVSPMNQSGHREILKAA
jgi:recombination associated protein RdgC